MEYQSIESDPLFLVVVLGPMLIVVISLFIYDGYQRLNNRRPYD